MADRKKYNSRELTGHLKTLLAEAHDMTVEGDLITKGEAIARLLIQKALGWEEKTKDDEGKELVVLHKPEAWAIQLVYDRVEGKTPQAVTEDDVRIKAAERVRELAKQRMNSLVDEIVVGKSSGPPKLRKKRT